MNVLRATAIWEALQGPLPCSRLKLRERLPYGLAQMRSQVGLSNAREAILGIYRMTDKDHYKSRKVMSLQALQKFIASCNGDDPNELAHRFWSVGAHQADASPAEIPGAVINFQKCMKKMLRKTGQSALRDEIEAIRDRILAHSDIHQDNKILVKRRRQATILTCQLVSSAVLIFHGYYWYPKKYFRGAMQQANLFWNAIEEKALASSEMVDAFQK